MSRIRPRLFVVGCDPVPSSICTVLYILHVYKVVCTDHVSRVEQDESFCSCSCSFGLYDFPNLVFPDRNDLTCMSWIILLLSSFFIIFAKKVYSPFYRILAEPKEETPAAPTMATAALRELEDYLETGRHKDGLSKCNKFLKKSPANNQLLYFKANFLFSLMQHDEGNRILDDLCNRNPAIVDLNLIAHLDELATTSVMDDYPRPLSNGPRPSKLWANATNAAGKNGVIVINQRRFSNAVNDQRWQDAATVSLYSDVTL
jgi:hypothetical protein